MHTESIHRPSWSTIKTMRAMHTRWNLFALGRRSHRQTRTTEQSLRWAASAEEEDTGRRSPPDLAATGMRSFGGGEGLCLHLLLPAGPGLASPSSCRGGRKHLAAAMGPIWGWWWPRSHRIPLRRRWIWRFIAGLDRKVQYFSEVRRGLVEGSTTTRLKVKESAAMRAKVYGRGEERILAASRSRARRRQAHRWRRRRVRKEEGERELSSRE